MKSSSRLFPVQLISAEVSGSLAEDVYLIRPQNSPDKSVQIAVTHLTPLNESSSHEEACQSSNASKATPVKPALILLHGCYQNRRLWFSADNTELVNILIEQGFDIWLMEQRGHGMSPRNDSMESNTLDDYARYDIPAVNAFVGEKTGTAPSWVGYGEGVGALLLALGSRCLKEEVVTHVTGLGSPFGNEPITRIPFSHLMTGSLNFIPKKNRRRGPEMENSQLIRQLLKESAWPKVRGESMGIDLWAVLQEINTPLYWLAANDELGRLDPGLQKLQKCGSVGTSIVPMDIDQLLPEQIHNTLADKQTIEALLGAASTSIKHLWQRDKSLITGNP
jgi:pimeloyl-ACP methyl ester carboxylesterase